jgi:hypothetical protein
MKLANRLVVILRRSVRSSRRRCSSISSPKNDKSPKRLFTHVKRLSFRGRRTASRRVPSQRPSHRTNRTVPYTHSRTPAHCIPSSALAGGPGDIIAHHLALYVGPPGQQSHWLRHSSVYMCVCVCVCVHSVAVCLPAVPITIFETPPVGGQSASVPSSFLPPFFRASIHARLGEAQSHCLAQRRVSKVRDEGLRGP